MDSKKDVPVRELAMLYLSHHHDDLNTPEEYLSRFIEVQEAILKHFEQIRQENATAISIPDAAFGNVRPSEWKRS